MKAGGHLRFHLMLTLQEIYKSPIHMSWCGSYGIEQNFLYSICHKSLVKIDHILLKCHDTKCGTYM